MTEGDIDAMYEKIRGNLSDELLHTLHIIIIEVIIN